jgi:hypothetical protein
MQYACIGQKTAIIDEAIATAALADTGDAYVASDVFHCAASTAFFQLA